MSVSPTTTGQKKIGRMPPPQRPPANSAAGAPSSDRVAVIFVKPKQREMPVVRDFYDALSSELERRGLIEVHLGGAAAKTSGKVSACLKRKDEKEKAACIRTGSSKISAEHTLIIDANVSAAGECLVTVRLVDKSDSIMRAHPTFETLLTGDSRELAKTALDHVFKLLSLDMPLDVAAIPAAPPPSEPTVLADPPLPDLEVEAIPDAPSFVPPEAGRPRVSAEEAALNPPVLAVLDPPSSPKPPSPALMPPRQGLSVDAFVQVPPVAPADRNIFGRFRTPMILGGGAVVASVAVVVGSAYGSSASGYSEAANASRRRSEAMTKYGLAKDDAFVANVSFGAAVVAAIGAGALLYFTGDQGEEKQDVR